jgi:hypothetical protein
MSSCCVGGNPTNYKFHLKFALILLFRVLSPQKCQEKFPVNLILGLVQNLISKSVGYNPDYTEAHILYSIFCSSPYIFVSMYFLFVIIYIISHFNDDDLMMIIPKSRDRLFSYVCNVCIPASLVIRLPPTPFLFRIRHSLHSY